MEFTTLRLLEAGDLARHYQSLLNDDNNNAVVIAKSLLQAVHDDFVPPRVMMIYLSVCKSMDIVSDALSSRSRAVRRAAIQQFGRHVRSGDWRSAWQRLGWEQGISQLIARSSISEVSLFCHVLGHCTTPTCEIEKRQRIAALLKELLAKFNGDDRPLMKYYAMLLPACTSAFVQSVLEDKQTALLKYADMTHLENQHSALFQDRYIKALLEGKSLECTDATNIKSLLKNIPNTPTNGTGLSGSMQYALAFLRVLVVPGREMPRGTLFYADLVGPLLRRVTRRKVPQPTILEIVQLIVLYLQANPNARTELALWDDDKTQSNQLRMISLFRRIIKLWRSKPAVYTESLCALIRLAPESVYPTDGSRDILSQQNWMKIISHLNRLPQHGTFRCDMLCYLFTKGTASGASFDKLHEHLPESIPTQLFTLLPRPQAQALLSRLMSSRPANDFLSPWRHTIFAGTATPDSSHGDVALLEIYFNRGEEELEARAVAEVERRKTEASRSREQADRSFHAKSAICMAVANGSVVLLKETLLWTRRYIRDSLTLVELYARDFLWSAEFKALLSGITVKLNDDKVGLLADLRSNIHEADSVLLDMLETACLSLREPSFQAHNWWSMLGIFGATVKSRIDGTRMLKQASTMSDDALYDYIWKPTIEMLITVETVCLKSENEKLRSGSHLGFPLGYASPGIELPILDRFFHDLAGRRDLMWQDHRKTKTPAVTTLPEPWPRGLPIQELFRPEFDTTFIGPLPRGLFINELHSIASWTRIKTGTNTKTKTHWTYVPVYVSQRAKHVVFLPPAQALAPNAEDEGKLSANDEELLHTIKDFVDDYMHALWIYVNCGGTAERDMRRDAAYQHALTELTGDRMTARESVLYWRSIFAHTEVPLPPEANLDEWQPSLPAIDHDMNLTEWNPAAGSHDAVMSRELPRTILDCMLNADHFSNQSSSRTNSTILSFPASSTEKEDAVGAWDVTYIQKFTRPSAREALIASALLYFDSQKGGGPRLLAEVSSAGTEHRYPAMYLDDDFLSLDHVDQRGALQILAKFIIDIPTSLMTVLTRNALDLLATRPPGADKAWELEEMCIKLLALLAKSDRPDLASDMILQTILNRPEASSWHRQLLPKTYFKELSPQQVQDFLTAFATAIESRSKSKAQSDEQSTEPPAAFVKISTIKALAQLMQGADFISQSGSVKILRSVFRKVTHIDVRCSILDVFLDILGDTSSPHEDIIEVLQDAVLIAGSFDERTGLLSEEQWLNLHQDGNLPDIYADIDNSQTPILQKLMNLGSGSQHLMDRIVVPIVGLSMQNQRRWMEAFLQQNKADLPDVTIADFPTITIQPELLGSLIRSHRSTLPATVAGIFLLDCYSTYILTSMSSPPAFKAVSQHILASHTLRNSPAGKYILAIYDKDISSHTRDICPLISSLPRDHRKANGITTASIQTFILHVAEVLMQHFDNTFEAWDILIRQFAPPVTGSLEVREAWLTYVRPMLEKIVDRVNALRSTDWLNDPSRQPAVLPSTFLQHLWLLHQRGAIIPAGDVFDVLVEIADHAACHIEFATLKAEVLRVEAGLKLGLALSIDAECVASGEKCQPRVRMMAVDIAEAMVRAAPGKHTEGSKGLREMLGRWCEDDEEEIRTRGLGLRKFLGIEEGEGVEVERETQKVERGGRGARGGSRGRAGRGRGW